eukprot:gene2368-8677_t
MQSSLASRTSRACAPAPRATRNVVTRATGSQGVRGWVDKAAIGLTAAALTLSLGQVDPAEARLTAGDPVTNPSAILRYALPIDNKQIRQVQKSLEAISEQLRIPGSKSLGPVGKSISNAQRVLEREEAKIIADFAPDKKEEGIASIAGLKKSLEEFQVLVQNQEKQQVTMKQREALDFVGSIEEDMVTGMKFTVPDEYKNLPQLLGRSTLEMKVELSETPEGPRDAFMTIVLDGYNAPVSAGAFEDLVLRGFYDNTEIQRSDGFVIQTGQPADGSEGFKLPNGEIRRVPLEVLVIGDEVPVYNESLEDAGRSNETIALPFNAYGTMAWARNEFEPDSASSQVFWLLKESEITPAGSNLLDGRFAVFGYMTVGQEELAFMKVGDKIDYIKVLSGAENLVNGPGSKAPPVKVAPEVTAE